MNAADGFRFKPLTQLLQMPLADLMSLWELVPTERQRQYKAIYDQFIHSEGVAGSDAAELKALTQLLEQHYAQNLVVPLLPKGDHWVRVPIQIRQAAETNAAVDSDNQSDSGQAVRPAVPMLPIILVVCVGVLIFGLLTIRGLMARSAAAVQEVSATSTATLRYSPTPTSIALEAQDDIIQSSNSGGSPAYYPVNLRVVMHSEAQMQPRVFVVQRRAVKTTEWNFDDNPDIASYIAGLSVRPVIGIPWSAANAALFEAMDENTTFVLQMNTGNTMQFNFAVKQSVNRSDTSWFRQVGPGLVLTLIGERHLETNEPTSERVIVAASYDVKQELSLSGGITGVVLPSVTLPPPTLTVTPVQRIDVQVVSVMSSLGRVTVRLRIYNGRTDKLEIGAEQVHISFGYAANPPGPAIPAEIPPFHLQPGQAVDLESTFAWQGEPYAALSVFDYRFAISLVIGN